MVKNRPFKAQTLVQNSTPVEVIAEDVTNHPLCLHGPTLLFSSEKGRFFACASCRNKKDCVVHIDEEDWKKEGVRQRNEKYYKLIPKLDKVAAWNHCKEVKSRHPSDRAYCHTCQELFIPSQSRKHLKEHRIVLPLTDEQLANPTTFLQPLEDDQHEAQYMFTKKSVSTVLGILRNNKISNILCIGTPSIHEAAQEHPDFDSLLLDYDTRYHMFHPTHKYLWYNMFNNYLFVQNEDEKVLKKFFKGSKSKGIAIVMDPPFGGRVEPLIQTIKELSEMYSKVCETEDKILPVIWAFPYFAEPYITNMMPEIKMHDYQVEYQNHKKFQNKKGGRKFGSPVRFFTNLPFSTIDLSNDSSYKRCDKCKYWVSVSNVHCTKCRECTSKNGMTYKHCNVCKRCVKPTFVHCAVCGRCCHEKHVCGTVVESQVEYQNHKKFQNKKGGRKFGSPVRFFTNLPFSTIDLSNDSSYKRCDKCKYWVSVSNVHCTKCRECTSKNGMTYKHCNVCKRCVKPTFVHCAVCGRCCHEKHVCGTVVESQSCYNCNEKGHKKTECPQREGESTKKKRKSIK